MSANPFKQIEDCILGDLIYTGSSLYVITKTTAKTFTAAQIDENGAHLPGHLSITVIRNTGRAQGAHYYFGALNKTAAEFWASVNAEKAAKQKKQADEEAAWAQKLEDVKAANSFTASYETLLGNFCKIEYSNKKGERCLMLFTYKADKIFDAETFSMIDGFKFDDLHFWLARYDEAYCMHSAGSVSAQDFDSTIYKAIALYGWE